jgi:DNA-binding GntR family transcriptional regulator
VDVRPRKGTFVTEFTLDDYRETLDIRRALELLAAETVCDHVGDDDVHALRALMREMERVVASERDPAEAARRHDAKNLEFHLRLVRLSGNRRLVAMYEDLRAHLRIARAHLDAHEWRSRVDTETREHGQILTALEARDASRLADALHHHLTRSASSLIDDVARREGRPTRQDT